LKQWNDVCGQPDRPDALLPQGAQAHGRRIVDRLHLVDRGARSGSRLIAYDTSAALGGLMRNVAKEEASAASAPTRFARAWSIRRSAATPARAGRRLCFGSAVRADGNRLEIAYAALFFISDERLRSTRRCGRQSPGFEPEKILHDRVDRGNKPTARRPFGDPYIAIFQDISTT
jgi:hypothetical protein